MSSTPSPLGAFENQPTNINFLALHRFRVIIKRIPNVVYFCQEANLPGVTVGAASQSTPFVDIPRPGDKCQFEDLTITFPVDEDFKNYMEIFKWITALGFPKKFDQYKRLATGPDGVYSEISLLILDSESNVSHTINFKGAFPTGLSGISFNVKEQDVSIPLATATFKYEQWEPFVPGAFASEV